MSLTQILPFISTAVILVFVIMVFRRYFVTHSLAFLFWGLGLAMFGVASFAEAYLALSWNKWVFFAWYLFGAALSAAWIGHGTLYLLVRKRWPHVVTALLLAGSLLAAYLMFQAVQNLNESAFNPALPVSVQYRDIMPAGAPVRLATPFLNIYGLLVLAGGAIWSAYLFWRKQALPNRVLGNILIAAGALSIGLASTLTRFGIGQYLYLGELLSAVLMFAGFLVASRHSEPKAKSVSPPA
jgi:hypothetical protein